MEAQSPLLWLPVILSLSLLAVLFIRSRGRDVLAYVIAFYFYFAFGPVVNHLLGNDIYAGILSEQMWPAVLLMTLAMAGMFAVAFLVKPKLASPEQDHSGGRHYPLMVIFLIALIIFTIAVLVFVVPRVIGINKHAQVAAVGADIHYSYLLLQFYAASLYLVARRSTIGTILYRANFGLYVLYCLAFSERDFMFALAAVAVISVSSGRARLGVRHLAGAGVLLYVATVLFAARMSDVTVDFTTVLNQGSVLFVDSSVVWLVPDYLPFMDGWTYLNSVASLLPRFLHQSDLYLLAWFVEQFAPGSESGYGFSLSAEAYLNFGFIGAPIVFAILAGAHRWVTNRIDRHPLFAYTSVLFTGWILYSFRGDSLQLVKGMTYGVALFAAFYATSHALPAPRDAGLPPGVMPQLPPGPGSVSNGGRERRVRSVTT